MTPGAYIASGVVLKGDISLDMKIIAVCFIAALLAGFIHGSLGMGFGMIAMATVTSFIPYNNASAVVSLALLVLCCQMSFSLREYIDVKVSIPPAIALTAGKIIGIVLMMNLNTSVLRLLLGLFLIIYSASQLLNIKSMKIKGTMLQGLAFCGLGGFFGGVFNVSGPAAAIYFQAKYSDDPKRYAANMNFIFVPSAIIAPLMHVYYGNYNTSVMLGGAGMIAAVLLATQLGVSVLKKIKAGQMRRLSYIYIIIMGIIICISG